MNRNSRTKLTARKSTGGLPPHMLANYAGRKSPEANSDDPEEEEEEVINVSSGESEGSEESTEAVSDSSNSNQRSSKRRKVAMKSSGRPPPPPRILKKRERESGGEPKEETNGDSPEKDNSFDNWRKSTMSYRPRRIGASEGTHVQIKTARKSYGGHPPRKNLQGAGTLQEVGRIMSSRQANTCGCEGTHARITTTIKSYGGHPPSKNLQGAGTLKEVGRIISSPQPPQARKMCGCKEEAGTSQKAGRFQARKSTGVPPKWRSEQVEKSENAGSDESESEPKSRTPKEPGRRYPKGGKKWSAIVAHNSNSENGSQNPEPSTQSNHSSEVPNGKATSSDDGPEPDSSAKALPDLSTDEESLCEEAVCDHSSVRESILKLDGWNLSDATDTSRETFCKEYSFKGFNEAWNFMSQVTIKLQIMNHHPDWHQVNNKVKVSLPSSDADGLTSKDAILAQFMDKVAKGINA